MLKRVGSKTIMKHEILRQTLIPDAMLSIAGDEDHTAGFDTMLDHLYIDDAGAADDKVDFRVGVAMRGEMTAERPGLAFAAGRTGGDARRQGGGGRAVGGEEGFPGDTAVVAVVVAFRFEGVGDVLVGEDDGFRMVGFGCGGAAGGGDEVAHVEGDRGREVRAGMDEGDDTGKSRTCVWVGVLEEVCLEIPFASGDGMLLER